MKTLLILPIMIAVLAGCAANSTTQPAVQANGQRNVQPASQSLEQPFKMVKPKPVNGKAGANKSSSRT